MSQIKYLLAVNETEIEKTRRYYNKSKEDISKDVNVLLDWLNKQPHLPIANDRARLERFLLQNDFDIDRTKLRLDKFYTYRGLCPDFKHIDLQSTAMKNFRKSVIMVPMPKLMPTMERVIIIKYLGDAADIYNFKDFMAYIFMIANIQLSYDYNRSNRFVFDTQEVTLTHIGKMDVSAVYNAIKMYLGSYCDKLSVDYINCPQVFDIMWNILKQAIEPRVFSKFHVHPSIESLYTVVPREYLPIEYGGQQPSIYELQDKWVNEMVYQNELLTTQSKLVSNEKLRIGAPIYAEVFGSQGTFRNMNID